MNSNFFPVRTKYLVLAAAAGLIGGLPIIAAPALAQNHEEITVVAPRELQRKEVGRSPTGARIELISLTRRVSYVGLDLTKQSDVAMLEGWVKDTAKDNCRKLDEMYPPSMYPLSPSTQNCVKAATDEAMMQVNAAIAAAHK